MTWQIFGTEHLMEHTFPSEEQQRAFDADMERRTNVAKAKGLGADDHWLNFLGRIQTREAFRFEVVGKLQAVRESGFPLSITEEQVNELVSIISLDTIGDPQIWPK